MVNWKGIGRKRLWRTGGVFWAFTWRDWGKPFKNSDLYQAPTEYKSRVVPPHQPFRLQSMKNVRFSMVQCPYVFTKTRHSAVSWAGQIKISHLLVKFQTNTPLGSIPTHYFALYYLQHVPALTEMSSGDYIWYVSIRFNLYVQYIVVLDTDWQFNIDLIYR